jgi:hypothetical protein
MLDVIEEAKREELKAKCREMKVLPPTDIFIGLQVHDKGNLIFDDVQRGHSWTRNYWNYIYGNTSNCSGNSSFGAGYISFKRTATYIDVIWPVTYLYGNLLTYNENTNWGIVVGTGSTAFDIEQYDLATRILNGNTSGKLYYNASVVNSTTYAPVSKTWTVVGSRIFNNNSGGSIVVAETGLMPTTIGSVSQGWLFERSLLSPTVTVPDAAQLTVTYTIVDDFSAID